MNAGYVRLSRDDDKRNYVSIENQKLIINQYAAEKNQIIDRWYEDDGVTGYVFDRPGFNQMMEDLGKDIDTVYVKDFSRLGRHNAKVLLLLDEFQERGKHLIVIDDNYDSLNPDDDVIGIKTWYNEKYVKDTSRKIKRVLGARQKEGTLMITAPFGYKRNSQNKEQIEIVENEAECVRMIYRLYIQGSGYRKIATFLTEDGMPTPSMIRHDRELAEGISSKRHIATMWTDSMIKDILDNDFYVGTLRLHKRARATIHGKDKRVPKEEQYIFTDHHPAIIDRPTFDLVQDIKVKRMRHNYRGSRGQWLGSAIPNPFSSCLYCKDCGSRLTPITRKTENSGRTRKYYICSKYNTKGRQYCSKAHLIEEKDLMEDAITYIKLCRDTLHELIITYDVKDYEDEKDSVEEKKAALKKEISISRQQLKTLFSQKVRDIAGNLGNDDIINETYGLVQNDLILRIQKLEQKLKELEDKKLTNKDVKEKLKTALNVVDEIVGKGTLNRHDIEVLIERIAVDESGLPEIELKYGLSGFVKYSPAESMNQRENEIIYMAMKLICEDGRGYTSAKYLSEKLTMAGYKKSNKAVLPYISYLIEIGILEATDNPLKPYNILKTDEEIELLMEKFYQGIPHNDVYGSALHIYEVNRRHA